MKVASKTADDDDDDYMSDTFMKKVSDIRPGIANGLRSVQRQQRIESERHDFNERTRIPTKIQLEKQKRDEALSQPIGRETKGFALMSKMGYKPGMSLGRKRRGSDEQEGIKEPISIDVKSGRQGLGHEAEEKRKSHDRIRAHCEWMGKRAKINSELIVDFRHRKRTATVQKQLIGDIVKSRKVCQELDSRSARNQPFHPWFWPSYRKNCEKNGPHLSTDNDTDYGKDDDDNEDSFVYSNGALAPEEENLVDFDEAQLIDRLTLISNYLRTEHFYCVWCGNQFRNGEDLRGNCPGSSRHDHDDGDNDL